MKGKVKMEKKEEHCKTRHEKQNKGKKERVYRPRQ
jgi:hypothetical protein